jgi:hypothetical protein
MTRIGPPLKVDPLWGRRCVAYNLQAELTDDARQVFVQAQEVLRSTGSGLLTCPPHTLHISVACILSVRERYGVPKGLLWKRHGPQWVASLRNILAAVRPFEVIFLRLEVADAAVIAVAEPRDEVAIIRAGATRILADAGVPSYQPSIIHTTVLRYGSPDLHAERLTTLASTYDIKVTVPVQRLVLSKESVYPSLITKTIEYLPLAGHPGPSTPSTFP